MDEQIGGCRFPVAQAMPRIYNLVDEFGPHLMTDYLSMGPRSQPPDGFFFFFFFFRWSANK